MSGIGRVMLSHRRGSARVGESYVAGNSLVNYFFPLSGIVVAVLNIC